jgi:hypothetical protein
MDIILIYRMLHPRVREHYRVELAEIREGELFISHLVFELTH